MMVQDDARINTFPFLQSFFSSPILICLFTFVGDVGVASGGGYLLNISFGQGNLL